mmetsp:Transcript_13927/g.27182  ORF Transcript_13927/g.27182 Transcript_13927/m.27182 type:complete len:625 (+) Transcript_13927:54-1928(+)
MLLLCMNMMWMHLIVTVSSISPYLLSLQNQPLPVSAFSFPIHQRPNNYRDSIYSSKHFRAGPTTSLRAAQCHHSRRLHPRQNQCPNSLVICNHGNFDHVDDEGPSLEPDDEVSTASAATPTSYTSSSSSSAAAATAPTATTTSYTVNAATLRFNNKLNTLSKSYDATTATRVEKMLLQALENYQFYLKYKHNNNHERNKQQTRNEANDDKSTHDEIQDTLIEISTNNSDLIVPNTISFTNAITAWARCTRKDSAKRAQALLDRMHALYDEGWTHVQPNKISYNSVITAWARSAEKGSAKKAEELLRRMYEFYEAEGGAVDLKPDSRSFNAVINAVARSREKNCADRAKFLLDEMGRRYNEGDEDLAPDALTFGAIINAYANSLEEGASDKAAQLLMHMESLYQLGFENAKPATFVYNACMNAFAKDPLGQGSAKSGSGISSAEKAQQLLNSMEKRYEEERDERVKPDCISYSTVINAHANSATTQSGENADAILTRMIHRYLIGDNDCKPNAIAFTAAIKAHSSSINATISTHASASGDDCDFESNDISSNNCKKQIELSAKRCEELLQQLCLLYQTCSHDRTLKPTAVTFDLVTRACTQARNVEGVWRVKELRSVVMNEDAVK